MNKTGNEIRNEGAGELSEALKINTTLTTLNLAGVHHQQGYSKQVHYSNRYELNRQLDQN